MCGIAGEKRLVRFERTLVCGLEERKRRPGISVRTQHAATLELEADVRDGIATRQRLGLGEQTRASVEVVAQSLHARELRQNLGATGVGLFTLELLAQAELSRVE